MFTAFVVVTCFGIVASCFVIFINMADGLPFRKLGYLVARTLFIASIAVIGILSFLFAIRTLVGE